MASVKTEKEHEFQHELTLRGLKDIWAWSKKMTEKIDALTARVKELETATGVGDGR